MELGCPMGWVWHHDGRRAAGLLAFRLDTWLRSALMYFIDEA
jgi:hypothetical protein